MLPLSPSLSPSGPEPEPQDNPHPVGGWPLLCSCPLPPSPLSSAFSSFKVVGGHLPQGAHPETWECQPHSPSWQHGPSATYRETEASHVVRAASGVWKARVPVLALLVCSPFPTLVLPTSVQLPGPPKEVREGTSTGKHHLCGEHRAPLPRERCSYGPACLILAAPSQDAWQTAGTQWRERHQWEQAELLPVTKPRKLKKGKKSIPGRGRRCLPSGPSRASQMASVRPDVSRAYF